VPKGGASLCLRRLFDRHDDPLTTAQQMAETQNRAPLVLDVVCRGHADVSMAELLLRSGQSVARIDLGTEFLAKAMQRRL
jgi:hypothetical protein